MPLSFTSVENYVMQNEDIHMVLILPPSHFHHTCWDLQVIIYDRFISSREEIFFNTLDDQRCWMIPGNAWCSICDSTLIIILFQVKFT
jgi:hypothetical protein